MACRSKENTRAKRKVKSHKKSRNGCTVCKFRCVKCDEGKPRCKNCLNYGALCSYDRATLQTNVERVVSIAPMPYWPNKTQELLNKFQARTAETVSAGPLLYLYQHRMMQMALVNPHLKFALLAITSMHDRQINGLPGHKLSTFEAQQWYQAAHHFRKQLSIPQARPETQASLVMTSSLLFQITFCYTEAEDYSDAWPLCNASPSDLSWLKLTTGKKEVLKLAQSLLQDDVYKTFLLGPDPSFALPLVYDGGLPYELASLWNLSAEERTNPYYNPAVTLAQGLCSRDVMGLLFWFLKFISDVGIGFERLLEDKDAGALLLLGCWFSIVAKLPLWWTKRRVMLESEAIRRYLLLHHQDLNPEHLMRLGTSLVYLPDLKTAGVDFRAT